MGLPLIYRRNALIFPGGGRPGFDPSHAAAKGITVTKGTSVIATGNGALASLLGQTVTVSGTGVVSKPINSIGMSTFFTSGAINFCEVSGQIAVSTSCTVALIVVLTAINNNFCGFGNAGAAAMGTTGLTLLRFNGVNSTITVSLNTPWFFAASVGPATINFVATNLKTGQIFSVTAASGGAITATANFLFGTSSTASNATGPYIACGMMNYNYMPMPQLLAWAQRPWDFWYPPTVENLIFSSLSMVSTPVVTVTKRFLPLMGVGR